MEKRFYKELWQLRFQKMLNLEEESIVAYQSLLEECQKRFKDHPIIPHFETLIADEKKHAALVRELLKILERQTD